MNTHPVRTGVYLSAALTDWLELDCVSGIDSNGRTIWIADAHRRGGKRFVVHSDEKLTAFVEPESVIHCTISF